MPHHNRARLADLSLQGLNPSIPYKSVGKNGLLVAAKSTAKILEKAEKKSLKKEEISTFETPTVETETVELKTETTDPQIVKITLDAKVEKKTEGFLIPPSAQKISTLEENNSTLVEKDSQSKKKNKQKSK